jgi:predicted permease
LARLHAAARTSKTNVQATNPQPNRKRLSEDTRLTDVRTQDDAAAPAEVADVPTGEGASPSKELLPLKRRKRRKPFNWSTALIATLVAISATLVYRRNGLPGLTDIFFHDAELFGGILPRMLAGCTLGAFVSEMLPQDKVSRALGANSGFRGLVIGTAFGALLPGGPFTAYPVASALLTIGADFGAVIAMVTAWVLIGYGRAISWELPILGTDFTVWRIITCLPIPVLAGALGRFFYIRLAHRLKLGDLTRAEP